MKHSVTDGIDAYRVGGKRRSPHWRHRWHVDLWFRSWQAEWPDCRWAPRAWTRAGVIRKAERWRRSGRDIARQTRVHTLDKGKRWWW